MADGLVVKLEGVGELKRAMAGAAADIRKKAVRGALREAGKVIQAAARQAAPVLQAPEKYRRPGTVRKAIAVRASKYARGRGDEGVYVNVRPLRGAAQKKKGKAGAKNPNDPYYWRFLEFGTKHMAARPFLRPAVAQKGEAAVRKFMASVVPQIEKLNAKANRGR
ncbi:MAG TPA: HK97 gp10 family phage protein [Candidatus Desulfobacillus denitrificans]|nr:HK97 gp10 family phage protein [Candidatus Desulfobacillus denitrificans]